MPLAYLFWHRPRDGVDPVEYEDALMSFLAALDRPCASFRLSRLPFDEGPGYEDWYLVDDWAGLGELNATAVDAHRRPSHDQVAAMAGAGWGGVYAPVRGRGGIPDQATWLEKPPGEAQGPFVEGLPEGDVWQRQLVLGPAAEFCLTLPGPAGRERLGERRAGS